MSKWMKRLRKRVAQTHSLNQLILEAAGEGIFGLDREGAIIFVNPVAAGIVGRKIQNLVGQPMHPLLHHSQPDGSPLLWEECPVRGTLNEGHVHQNIRNVMWRHDGSCFPVELTSRPIRNDAGALVGAAVTFRGGGVKTPMVQQSGRPMVGHKNWTHTVAPGAAIAERRDPEVESNLATTLPKKSGAGHLVSSGILFTLILFLTGTATPADGGEVSQATRKKAMVVAQATKTEQGAKPGKAAPKTKAGETKEPAGAKGPSFTSPEGKPLLSPEEVLKQKPETKTEGYSGTTFGESLLELGTKEQLIEKERSLIKAQILSFIPPLLQSAIVGDAFVLPPKTIRASIDYGFTNFTGTDDVFGASGVGNFTGARMQSATLTISYGFDLNRKYLHSFTASLAIPYLSVDSRGFIQPSGPTGTQTSNAGSLGELGDISLIVKKKLMDQANFPVGVAMVGGVFFPTGSNSQKFGSNGVVSCTPQCPNGQPTFVFNRFTDDGRFPAFFQPGTGGAWAYLLGSSVTRQFLPGDIPFLAGTPFDRGALHVGGFHRWNFESNGIDPGGQSTAFASLVTPIYKDFLSLEVTNLWLVQQADSYRGFFEGKPRQPFSEGSTGFLGPSLIFSPDPQIRFRATSLFRVKEPNLGPAAPFLVNFGLDVTF